MQEKEQSGNSDGEISLMTSREMGLLAVIDLYKRARSSLDFLLELVLCSTMGRSVFPDTSSEKKQEKC